MLQGQVLTMEWHNSEHVDLADWFILQSSKAKAVGLAQLCEQFRMT